MGETAELVEWCGGPLRMIQAPEEVPAVIFEGDDRPISDEDRRAIRNACAPRNVSFATFSVTPPPNIDPERVFQEDSHYQSLPYRAIMRFYSGRFAQHEALLPYDVWFRIDADVRWMRPLRFDPFAWFRIHDLVYACPRKITLFDNEFYAGRFAAKVEAFFQHHPATPCPRNDSFFWSPSNCTTAPSCAPPQFNLRVCNCHVEMGSLNFFRRADVIEFQHFLDADATAWYYDPYGGQPGGKLGDHVVKGASVAVFADHRMWGELSDGLGDDEFFLH